MSRAASARQERNPELRDLNGLLTLQVGDRPGLLLSADGRIVTASRRAAELLGQTPEQLAGSVFGDWASLLDQNDLDVVRIRSGKAQASTVRAERLDYQPGDGYIAVLLTEVRKPQVATLADTMHSAISRVNAELPGPNLSIRQTKWPDVTLDPVVQETLVCGLRLLAGIAGKDTAALDLRAELEGTQWAEIRLALHVPSLTKPASNLETDPMQDFGAFDVLWSIGGQVRVESGPRAVSLWLRVPVSTGSVAG